MFFKLATVCVATTILLIILVMLAWRGRSIDSHQARYLAGELSGTIVLLERMRKEEVQPLLLAASCYRQLGQNAQFSEKVERARSIAQTTDEVELAMAMYKIQHGQLDDAPLQLVGVLQSAGALETDARSVVIQGAYALNRLSEAKQLLDNWRNEQPDSAQLEYLTAVYLNLSGRSQEAESSLIQVIEQHPRHELSWLALAELYSRPPNVRFRQAELILERFTVQFPYNSDARLRLARIRRRLGHAATAEIKLTSSANSQAEMLERAKIEFDLGNYAESIALLHEVHLATPGDFHRLTDDAFQLSLQGQGEAGGELTHRVSWGATALALSGNHASARQIFEVAVDRTGRLRRLQDLTVRRALLPQQQALIDELNAVVSPAFNPTYPTLAQLSQPTEPLQRTPGLALYAEHCAVCHGENGDGMGPAACNQYPRPRSFRSEPLRMISAANGLATDADLEHTILHGQAGTSMPAFKQLADADVELLIDIVRLFMAQGLRERYARELAASHDLGNEFKVQWIAARSEPSDPIAVPDWSNISMLAARGREVFESAGCGNCHWINGEQPSVKSRLFDSLGRPIVAPDLGRDHFHGGSEPSEIFKRIVLGIPGTPHPALASVSAGDIQALVAYILSMRTPTPDVLSNHQRSLRAAQ